MRSKLSQYGNWDVETEMNAREVMAHRFSESSDAYDFALCARHRDGSIYGIAAGKQCRVGRPVTRTDALKTLAKQGVPREILGKIARIKDDKEFGKATRAISSGRKKQAATITPTKPTAASSIKPAAAKAGALTQIKRKEAATPDGRAEKQAKIAQLRAELKAKRDKQKETEKPKQDSTPASKAPKKPETLTKPMNREEALSMLAREGLVKTNRQRELLSKLSDEKLANVAARAAVRAEQGTLKIAGKIKAKGELDEEQAKRAAAAVRKLKYDPSGGKKEGGANLQSPTEAAKYAQFYTDKRDLKYKPPLETDPRVVKATLAQLKEEMPREDYQKLMSALGGKGSPTKEQLDAAGWSGRSERAQAVLKSLMDNDFRDVMGQELSWRQGLQLDHKKAGSTGGSDRPDNWIWISTASNQVKGGMEAAAQKRAGTPAEKEDFIRRGLITKLSANAAMTPDQVRSAKAAGSMGASAKAEKAAALRDNLPLMSPQQRAERIRDASGEDLKAMLKGSVTSEKVNPATGRKPSYRPVLSGGGSARVRKDYGTTPQMKSLMRMRWGEKLDDGDLKNIGGLLKASTGSTKSPKDKLDELLGNFPPTTGLTIAERQAIIASAS